MQLGVMMRQLTAWSAAFGFASQRVGAITAQQKLFPPCKLVSFILFAVLFFPRGADCAQLQPMATPQVVEITPNKTTQMILPAGARQTLSVVVPGGSIAFVEIEQLQGSAFASIAGVVPPLQFGSDAGVHSVVRVPVLGYSTGVSQIQLQSRDHYLPVRLQVTMVAPRAALPADQDTLTAYVAFAQADSLRRTRQASSTRSALELYDKAIALAEKIADRSLEEQAWIGKSRFSMYVAGDYGPALEDAQHAIQLISVEDEASPGPAMAVAAQAWKNLSSANSFLARYPEMIDSTNRSLALYLRLGDLYWQGILEGNVANVYLETGDTTHALASAQGALTIAQELQDMDGVGFTMATLAGIHAIRGEYQAALDANQAALDALSKSPDPDETGQIWMNLADIYDALNDPEHERAALAHGLALLRQAHDTANESSSLSFMAMLELRQHLFSDATRDLNESLALAQSQHLQRELCLAELGQAELMAAQGRSGAALTELKVGLALAAATKEAGTRALLLHAEGDLFAQSGQTANALDSYRRSALEWSTILDTEDASLARSGIAELEFRSGQRAAALYDILLALDGFETARNQIGNHYLSESFFAARHDSFDLAIEILMADAPSYGQEKKNDSDAWTIVERARAQTLMDEIRGASRPSIQPKSADVLEKSANVERDIAQTQEEIFHLSADAATEHDEALRRAEARLHALVFESDQINAEGSDAASLANTDLRAPSIADVQSRFLDHHSALIEYWVGRHSIDRWTITQSGVTSSQLPNSALLLRQVDHFKHLLLARESHPTGEDFATRQSRIAQADREAAPVAFDLGHRLIPPLDPSIQRLILVPDGPLDSLPFAALSRSRGRWLVQDYEIAIEPSTAIALALQQRQPHRDATKIAVFADPVYNRDDPRLAPTAKNSAAEIPGGDQAQVVRAMNTFDVAALPRLTGSSDEAGAIAGIAGQGQVLLYEGFQATPARVMGTSWQDVTIVHFATHAIVNFEQPELSGIVLSTFNRQGASQDGILWLHDIYRTSIPVPLVIVDGCRTANGKAIPGEGITGFAQAFLASGASGVIGSLWTVNDEAASELVPALYRGMLDDKLSPPAALRAAQLKLIANPAFSGPYDWAGFVFEGDGQTQMAASPR
jgi:CHAT domain-containing protein/tetratricopeptide (TPR) repeat protein